MSTATGEYWHNKVYKLMNFRDKEIWYGSLAMDAIIFASSIYFISIKRW